MDQDQLTTRKPLDYIKIFFRRKWLIIAPCVLGIIAGTILANTLPKTYESSTLMLVEEGKIINPLIQGLAVSTSTAQRLASLREQLLGWNRLNQLITTLDLAKDVKTQWEFEKLIKKLRANIKVRLRGANIISISYESHGPAQAMNVVKTITDIFISENLRQQNKEGEDAIAFINDQLALYQKKLKQTEIADMEEQLKTLLVDSTPKHPIVIELKKKIAAAQDELTRGQYTIKSESIGGTSQETKALKDELKQMREEIAASNPDTLDAGINKTRMASTSNEKLYKLLLLDKIDTVQARDQDVNQKLYNELLQRLESAKISQRLEASKEGTRYTILDPARLPLRPASPNKIMVLVGMTFLGLAAGFALVFAIEMFDHSFLGVDEAKAFLELPILGAISKIVTQADLKVRQARSAGITGISIVGGLVLLIVVILNVFVGN